MARASFLSKIQHLRIFKKKQLRKKREKELMNYGVPNKRPYLLLLEDLNMRELVRSISEFFIKSLVVLALFSRDVFYLIVLSFLPHLFGGIDAL
jgi:hypothetical protein